MSEKPMLGPLFATDIFRPAARKKLFGGYYVSGLTVVVASISTFQKGALLGFARREKFDLLCSLIAQSGGEASVADFCRNVTTEHWNAHGNDTLSLYEYACRAEFPDLDLTSPKVVQLLAKNEHRLGEVLNRFAISVARGIGFGATRPEDFQRMWHRSYERIDRQSWSTARQAGLNIPAVPTALPLEQAILPVLAETAGYVRQHFPSLVSVLDLERVESSR